MLLAHIDRPNTYKFLLRQPVFNEALDWIRNMKADHAPGIYQVRGELMFANVHGYETLPRTQCRYESHRDYIDLQYCIEGGEMIDWQLASNLVPDGPFDAEKDLQFYKDQPVFAGCDALSSNQQTTVGGQRPTTHSEKPVTAIHMTPGRFSIYFQEDAHRPKVNDGIHRSVRKLVVKIHNSLLR